MTTYIEEGQLSQAPEASVHEATDQDYELSLWLDAQDLISRIESERLGGDCCPLRQYNPKLPNSIWTALGLDKLKQDFLRDSEWAVLYVYLRHWLEANQGLAAKAKLSVASSNLQSSESGIEKVRT